MTTHLRGPQFEHLTRAEPKRHWSPLPVGGGLVNREPFPVRNLYVPQSMGDN